MRICWHTCHTQKKVQISVRSTNSVQRQCFGLYSNAYHCHAPMPAGLSRRIFGIESVGCSRSRYCTMQRLYCTVAWICNMCVTTAQSVQILLYLCRSCKFHQNKYPGAPPHSQTDKKSPAQLGDERVEYKCHRRGCYPPPYTVQHKLSCCTTKS